MNTAISSDHTDVKIPHSSSNDDDDGTHDQGNNNNLVKKKVSMGKHLKKMFGGRSSTTEVLNRPFNLKEHTGNNPESPSTFSTTLSTSFSKESCTEPSSLDVDSNIISGKSLMRLEDDTADGSMKTIHHEISDDLEDAIEVRRTSYQGSFHLDVETSRDAPPPDETSPTTPTTPTTTATQPTSSSHSGQGIAQDATLMTVSLSDHYPASEHSPKYSETEMKANIDAAVLEAEKEWTKKKFAQIHEDAKKETMLSFQKQIDSLKKDHDEEIKSLKDELRAAKEEYQIEMEALLSSSAKDDELNIEKFELMQKIVSLESQVESDKEKFDMDIQKVSDEHSAEIDELLAQLDVVEEEHKDKVEALERSVREKETIISALGTQLSEAIQKSESINKRFETLSKELESSQAQTEEANTTLQAMEEQVKKLQIDNANQLEEERKKRLAACQKVKNDMISAAEEQFEKANEHYIKLKKEYDSSQDQLKKVAKDLDVAKSQSETLSKERRTEEAKMKAEVAQLKASEYDHINFCNLSIFSM